MHSLIFGDGIYKHLNGKNYDNRSSNICPIRGYLNNGKTILNGYIAIYMPEHKKSFSNGCVYEHVIVAEKILGRELTEEECVHHKDHNRQNNEEDNLMVFATSSDHAFYHGGANIIKREDGAYIAIKDDSIFVKSFKNKNKTTQCKYNLCPICNENYKYIHSSMCKECRNKENSKNIPPKEEIEALIYSTPFTIIGKMYGVSDNAVRRWCRKYNLPSRKKDMNLNKSA